MRGASRLADESGGRHALRFGCSLFAIEPVALFVRKGEGSEKGAVWRAFGVWRVV